MAGIYIHIPFCRKACHYCNFHFSTSLKTKNDFVQALLREIEITASNTKVANEQPISLPFLKHEIITSIYLGGGTPSLISDEELLLIMNKIAANHEISNDVEITIEANPDDINSHKLKQWTLAGINRLSIGVQSFFDEDLEWMNRAHNAQQAVDAVTLSKREGFENITIDLIYGSPTLSDEKWKYNVTTAIALQVPHLSCYALTVEPFTPLDKLIKNKKLMDVDPEKQANQFLLLMKWLGEAGYEHYEISNFAKPGKRSRHNAAYWQGKSYLGLGPSAHSYNGNTRHWNIANNALYSQSLQNNVLPIEKETLTQAQQINEYIMTSLRTMEGLDLTYLKNAFGSIPVTHVEKEGRKHIESGRVTMDRHVLQLTNEGKLYADGIASDLFL